MTVWLPESMKEEGLMGKTKMRNPVLGGDDHLLAHKLLTVHIMQIHPLHHKNTYLKTEGGWDIIINDEATPVMTVPGATFDTLTAEAFDADGNSLMAGTEYGYLSIVYNSDGVVRLKDADYEVGEKFEELRYLPLLRRNISDTIMDLVQKVSALESEVAALKEP